MTGGIDDARTGGGRPGRGAGALAAAAAPGRPPAKLAPAAKPP